MSSVDSQTSISSGERRRRQLVEAVKFILSNFEQNLPLKEMRQKLSTFGRGELEDYIADCFIHQSHDNALYAFSYSINSLCPSILPMETCSDLFNQLSTAASDALRYGSLPGLLLPYGKALIDDSFGSIFTTQANVNKCRKRHFFEFAVRKNAWQGALGGELQKIAADWTQSGTDDSAVVILYGSSGVGKTCAALDLARNILPSHRTFVVYINLGSISNFSDARLGGNKNERNQEVKKIMMTAIAEAIFRDLRQTTKERRTNGEHETKAKILPNSLHPTHFVNELLPGTTLKDLTSLSLSTNAVSVTTCWLDWAPCRST